MFHALRQLRAKWAHALLLRRQRMEESLLRYRQGDSGTQVRPSKFAAALSSTGEKLAGFWLWLTTPFRALRDHYRLHVQKMQDMAMPLAAATDTHEHTHRLRSRWWDPLLLLLGHYIATRPLKDLRRGLPALFTVMLFVTAVLVLSGLRPSATRYTQLLQSAELAMSNQDYPKALIAYERMVQVGHDDPGTQFSLARCLAAMGEYQRAAQLLFALAPDDKLGYVPAHRVRAFLIMQSPQATPEDLALARRHLERVLAAHPEDDEAHGLLASLLLRMNDVTAARNEFVQGTDNRPDLALNAAILSRQIGDAKAMIANATIATVYYQGQLKKIDPDKDVPVEAVLSLAQALSLQKQYSDALAAIETYLPRSDHERLVKAILEICDVWQQEIDLRHGAEDLDRLQLAKTALTYQPTSRPWQLRLLDLTSDKSVVRPAAMKLLEQLGQDKSAGAEVCFFLGMDALRREQISAAREYLERSYTLLPNHAPTANNLACSLLTGKDQDPTRALKLATQAVDSAPRNPIYLETRGQALIALEKWPEAVADLEQALPGLENRQQAHENLSLAYAKLGQMDKSQEHKTLALTDKRN